MHEVYFTLVNCNPLTPLLRFVLDLLCNLFLRCCAAVGRILTGTSRRAVRLRQQGFLSNTFCDDAGTHLLLAVNGTVPNADFSVAWREYALHRLSSSVRSLEARDTS